MIQTASGRGLAVVSPETAATTVDKRSTQMVLQNAAGKAGTEFVNWYRLWGKRVLDVVLGGTAVIVLLPFLAVLAVCVRLVLGSPVLFRQERPGYSGTPFTMLKFRTMTEQAGPDGELLPDAERLTRFGRFLRSWSLDELPAFVNVLRGDMSLVGPRPLLTRYYPFFTEQERVRFAVRPGITGLAQVHGRNDLSWDLRLEKDVEYVRRYSLALDAQILLRTVLHVFRREGVQVDPGSTMMDLDEERRVTGQTPKEPAP